MIPLRSTNFKQSGEWPSKVILHHTAEFSEGNPRFTFDTQKFQSGYFMNYSYMKLKHKETKYHFIIENVQTDWYVINSQPLMTKCIYEDLDETYHDDIHIAFFGDYDKDLPPIRMYRVLAYRILAPVMRLFYLDENDIVLHNEISNDPSIKCPGEFIDKAKIYNQLRGVRRKVALRRG